MGFFEDFIGGVSSGLQLGQTFNKSFGQDRGAFSGYDRGTKNKFDKFVAERQASVSGAYNEYKKDADFWNKSAKTLAGLAGEGASAKDSLTGLEFAAQVMKGRSQTAVTDYINKFQALRDEGKSIRSMEGLASVFKRDENTQEIRNLTAADIAKMQMGGGFKYAEQPFNFREEESFGRRFLRENLGLFTESTAEFTGDRMAEQRRRIRSGLVDFGKYAATDGSAPIEGARRSIDLSGRDLRTQKAIDEETIRQKQLERVTNLTEQERLQNDRTNSSFVARLADAQGDIVTASGRMKEALNASNPAEADNQLKLLDTAENQYHAIKLEELSLKATENLTTEFNTSQKSVMDSVTKLYPAGRGNTLDAEGKLISTPPTGRVYTQRRQYIEDQTMSNLNNAMSRVPEGSLGNVTYSLFKPASPVNRDQFQRALDLRKAQVQGKANVGNQASYAEKVHSGFESMLGAENYDEGYIHEEIKSTLRGDALITYNKSYENYINRRADQDANSLMSDNPQTDDDRRRLTRQPLESLGTQELEREQADWWNNPQTGDLERRPDSYPVGPSVVSSVGPSVAKRVDSSEGFSIEEDRPVVPSGAKAGAAPEARSAGPSEARPVVPSGAKAGAAPEARSAGPSVARSVVPETPYEEAGRVAQERYNRIFGGDEGSGLSEELAAIMPKGLVDDAIDTIKSFFVRPANAGTLPEGRPVVPSGAKAGPSEARPVVPSEARPVVPSEARSAGPSEARPVVPSEARSAGPSEARSAGPSEARSAGPSEARSLVQRRAPVPRSSRDKALAQQAVYDAARQTWEGNIVNLPPSTGNKDAIIEAGDMYALAVQDGFTTKQATTLAAISAVEAAGKGWEAVEKGNYTTDRLIDLRDTGELSKLKGSSNAAIKALVKGGERDIFNKIYGGRMGNNEKGDGYKYRGRGYIMLTGKNNYKQIGDIIGVDLVDKPDLLVTDKKVARLATLAFMRVNAGYDATPERMIGVVGGTEEGKKRKRALLKALLQSLADRR